MRLLTVQVGLLDRKDSLVDERPDELEELIIIPDNYGGVRVLASYRSEGDRESNDGTVVVDRCEELQPPSKCHGPSRPGTQTGYHHVPERSAHTKPTAALNQTNAT